VNGASPARCVLVTGASGLIGSRVVSQLARERGSVETIVAMDVREPPADEKISGVEYHVGDVRDPTLAKELLTHAVDTVVHLAAVVTPGPNSTRELEYSIDVLGTRNVLECSLEAGVRQLVYTSSGAAYGYHADNPRPLRETDALRGNEEFAYSHHKRLVEEMLARAREQHPELTQLIFRRLHPEGHPGEKLGHLQRCGRRCRHAPGDRAQARQAVRRLARLADRGCAARPAGGRCHQAGPRAGGLPALPPRALQRAPRVRVRLHPLELERGVLRTLPSQPILAAFPSSIG
jgi:hypothetical protein